MSGGLQRENVFFIFFETADVLNYETCHPILLSTLLALNSSFNRNTFSIPKTLPKSKQKQISNVDWLKFFEKSVSEAAGRLFSVSRRSVRLNFEKRRANPRTLR